MDKQEKIVCAAIKKWVGEEVSVELFVDYPKKYKKQKSQINWIGYEKGFVTNHNRFVDAKEAMRIAVEENQIEAIRKVFDAIPDFHDKGIDSHEFGEAANAAIDIRDEYLARELKPEDLY